MLKKLTSIFVMVCLLIAAVPSTLVFANSYTVNIVNILPEDGGTVDVSNTNPNEGDVVIITVAPNEGYAIDYVNVKDADQQDIEVTESIVLPGIFTFTMPASDVNITVSFAGGSIDDNCVIEDLSDFYEYTGAPITPTFTVRNLGGTELEEGTDYSVSFSNNVNVDDEEDATLTITGMGLYTDSKIATFTITPKHVTVNAKNASKIEGAADPTFEAEVEGTIGEDTVSYTLKRISGELPGIYAINATGDINQGNYWVTYLPGVFTIKALHTVTFNVQGHGTAPGAQSVVDGNKVTKPTDLKATGYTFGGWYKEKACTNAWDFDKDTVTSDTTLYAKWTATGTTTTTTTPNTGDTNNSWIYVLVGVLALCGIVFAVRRMKTSK